MYACVSTFTPTHPRMHIHTYAHMYACMHVGVHAHTHTHTYRDSQTSVLQHSQTQAVTSSPRGST